MPTEYDNIIQRLWWRATIGFDDMCEAAEFEERVAAKLALGCESQTPCNGSWQTHWKLCNLRKGYWDCANCFLKVARLAVEEEMDNELA